MWEDKLCKDDELLLIAKIKTSLFKELEKAVKEMHSYDVPEIILLSIEDGANTYLDWINQVTR
jgi:periplasmic divalent cation tolerance protein